MNTKLKKMWRGVKRKFTRGVMVPVVYTLLNVAGTAGTAIGIGLPIVESVRTVLRDNLPRTEIFSEFGGYMKRQKELPVMGASGVLLLVAGEHGERKRKQVKRLKGNR